MSTQLWTEMSETTRDTTKCYLGVSAGITVVAYVEIHIFFLRKEMEKKINYNVLPYHRMFEIQVSKHQM